jgi:hypothetical protein
VEQELETRPVLWAAPCRYLSNPLIDPGTPHVCGQHPSLQGVQGLEGQLMAVLRALGTIRLVGERVVCVLRTPKTRSSTLQ